MRPYEVEKAFDMRQLTSYGSMCCEACRSTSGASSASALWRRQVRDTVVAAAVDEVQGLNVPEAEVNE